MADRRMMSKQLLDSKLMDELSDGAFRLYIQLCMNADDDGFLNNAERVTYGFKRTLEELNELWEKEFLIKFSSGIYLIKHWRIHNQIQKDRYNRTTHIEEFKLITWDPSSRVYIPHFDGVKNGLEYIAEWYKDDKNSKYQLTPFDIVLPTNVSIVYPNCIQPVSKLDTQISIDKYRLDKFSIAERSEAIAISDKEYYGAEVAFNNVI